MALKLASDTLKLPFARFQIQYFGNHCLLHTSFISTFEYGVPNPGSYGGGSKIFIPIFHV